MDTRTTKVRELYRKLRSLPADASTQEFNAEVAAVMKLLLLERNELRDRLIHCEHQLDAWSEGWAEYFTENDRCNKGVIYIRDEDWHD